MSSISSTRLLIKKYTNLKLLIHLKRHFVVYNKLVPVTTKKNEHFKISPTFHLQNVIHFST